MEQKSATQTENRRYRCERHHALSYLLLRAAGVISLSAKIPMLKNRSGNEDCCTTCLSSILQFDVKSLLYVQSNNLS